MWLVYKILSYRTVFLAFFIVLSSVETHIIIIINNNFHFKMIDFIDFTFLFRRPIQIFIMICNSCDLTWLLCVTQPWILLWVLCACLKSLRWIWFINLSSVCLIQSLVLKNLTRLWLMQQNLQYFLSPCRLLLRNYIITCCELGFVPVVSWILSNNMEICLGCWVDFFIDIRVKQ